VGDSELLAKYSEVLRDRPRATEFLQMAWKEERRTLDLPHDIEESLPKIFDLFFNPFKKKSSLRDAVHRLPTVRNLILHLDKDLLSFLTKNKLLLTIIEGEEEYITLTPEGVAIAYLFSKYGVDSTLSYDLMRSEDQERIELVLYENYRKYSLRNLQRIAHFSKEEKHLGVNQMSITLFLLINGSIGTERAFKIESIEVQEAVEKIVRAFVADAGDKAKKVYPFNWYLTTAKRLLGDVFYNKYPLYYIYEEKVDRVREEVVKSARKIQGFRYRWTRFLKEYEMQRPIFRSYGISHFSKSKTLELEQKVLM